MNKSQLPKELLLSINNEEIDFTAFSKHEKPKKKVLAGIVLLLYIFFLPTVALIVIINIFTNQESNYSSIDIDFSISLLERITPHLFPLIFSLMFFSIFLYLLIRAIRKLYTNGGFFVGTKDRLVNYKNGKMTNYGWESFTGNTQLDLKKQYLNLELRSSNAISNGNAFKKFGNKTVFLSGIDNMLEIEKVIRKRILENDPTANLI